MNIIPQKGEPFAYPPLLTKIESMKYMFRAIAIAYLVFLTMLLWTSDPARLVSWHGQLPWLLCILMPAAHLLSFGLLGILMTSARWPMPRWGIFIILAFYASLTEIAQGLTPHRTPEWGDWVQDIGGIAFGTGFCWLADRWMARRRRASCCSAAPSDPCEVSS
jgi:hypothetical protein